MLLFACSGGGENDDDDNDDDDDDDEFNCFLCKAFNRILGNDSG